VLGQFNFESLSFFWSIFLVYYIITAFVDLYLRLNRIEKWRLTSYLINVEREFNKKKNKKKQEAKSDSLIEDKDATSAEEEKDNQPTKMKYSEEGLLDFPGKKKNVNISKKRYGASTRSIKFKNKINSKGTSSMRNMKLNKKFALKNKTSNST
jgi:hypothetical protein